jgi:putative ABC transport system permease protein
MRPDDREFDDEIRGHLAISIRERIDRGETPEAARLAALREFGYVPAVRESMRRVWYGRAFDAGAALARDIRFAFRSLLRAKGLSGTVIVTLSLGIGANAAIFSVVRSVVLRPLVNRDEDRLLYIRQSAPGLGEDNTTFSIPEIDDLKARVKTVTEFGHFSTIGFTLIGLGDQPRTVKAGVVSGSFFDVMGLRPVLGRLLNATDDGPKASGAAVLTYRFWVTDLKSDPGVIGKTIRLGERTATIVGVLEPSVPYPADTEIISNVVTSPHHLSATMVTSRTHRMTELFGRLAPGATTEQARAEVTAAFAAMVHQHPEAYSPRAHEQISVTKLRDQIAAPARTILWLLLAAAAVVFLIACSNAANLILARSVRREGELAIRAALGAGRGALRRTLLAESIVLCTAGAVLGVVLARPLFAMVAGYAARFSVRALDATVDPSVLWVGVGLAVAASILLAFVPRLPSAHAPTGLGLSSTGLRMTPATKRRLRLFATMQIACSFVLLAGAGMLVTTLLALRAAPTSIDTRHVIVFNVPISISALGSPTTINFYEELRRRVGELPGVAGASVGLVAPWRDAGTLPQFKVVADGRNPSEHDEDQHARFRVVAPNFFAVLGVPVLEGRDFKDSDRSGPEMVSIVSQSVAQRLFPRGDAVNRHLSFTDPVSGQLAPTRIVGVVPDIDDENVVPGPAMMLYLPFERLGVASRLFVHATGDPYALVPAVTRIVRQLSAEVPVERAATLEDVRAEVLSPERLNAFVSTGFAGIALLIAVVGVAGVLAFSVSARTREFGVRLAVGSDPRRLLLGVLSEGVAIAAIGITGGAAGGYVLARLAARTFSVGVPGALPAIIAAVVLVGAAAIASLMPAARAARTDLLQALRAE